MILFNMNRALDHPNLGPKFNPILNAKKYVFSQFQTKNSQSDQTYLVKKIQMYQLKNIFH